MLGIGSAEPAQYATYLQVEALKNQNGEHAGLQIGIGLQKHKNQLNSSYRYKASQPDLVSTRCHDWFDQKRDPSCIAVPTGVKGDERFPRPRYALHVLAPLEANAARAMGCNDPDCSHRSLRVAGSLGPDG